jgi:hypothetical protein
MENIKKKVWNTLDHLSNDYKVHPITLATLRIVAVLQLLATIT